MIMLKILRRVPATCHIYMYCMYCRCQQSNVTTLRSAIRIAILSVVCNVGVQYTQRVEVHGNIFRLLVLGT